jgi:hypothetical protein
MPKKELILTPSKMKGEEILPVKLPYPKSTLGSAGGLGKMEFKKGAGAARVEVASKVEVRRAVVWRRERMFIL